MIRTCRQINPFFLKFLTMVFIAVIEIKFLGDAMDHTWLNGLIKKQLLRAAAIGVVPSSHSFCADATESME